MNQLAIFNYSVRNNDTAEALDVFIDGAIVDAQTQELQRSFWQDDTSVSFKSVRNQVLDAGCKRINFIVNSYGGHVGDAMAIHDWIVELENKGYQISTQGIGMVCSAATYIVSAARNSSITRNSFYMIHNVAGGISGDVNQIESYASTMRKFNDTITSFYATLTGQSPETIAQWMNKETWFTGTEAVTMGFVKQLTESVDFGRRIKPEAFPYANTLALNQYNANVKTNEKIKSPHLFMMNKLQEALENVFVNFGFVSKDSTTQHHVKPLPMAEFRNALGKAFEELSFEPSTAQLEASVANYFQHGLNPALEAQLQQLIENATSHIASADKLNALERELEALKGNIANSKGQAKPSPSASAASFEVDLSGISFS